ncbi:MAG TPA: cytochrome P450 [Lapillicoccus sp.]|nr:cytochrome P450 [Lapillicoccus sp.]
MAPSRLSFPSAREHPLDPPAVQTELRETCPVAPVELHDGQPAWLVTRYDDIRTVLSDERFSSAGLWRFAGSANRAAAERAETSFTVMDPPEHTHYRRLFTRYFTIKRVATLRPRIQQIVDETIDGLLARSSTADLVTDLALPIASQTMCSLVGVPYADHEWYESRAEVRSRMDGDPAEAEQAFQDLLAYMSGLVDQAPGSDADDIISAAVRDLLEPGLIEKADLVAALRLLLTAGHETTATMIATGTYVLLTHPDQLDEVRRDPDLLPGAIEELLRYVSMLFILVRTAKEDTEVAGQAVCAGDGLIVGPALANKDPRAFPDPDRFDIHRDNRHHVAFGFGPHQCLGQPVARLELGIVLETLLRRIPTLRLAVAPGDVPFKATNLVGVASLPVTW